MLCHIRKKISVYLCIDVFVFSVGAALGPLLAGIISPTGWNNVFYMLISADILACLVRNITLFNDITIQLGFWPLLLIPVML